MPTQRCKHTGWSAVGGIVAVAIGAAVATTLPARADDSSEFWSFRPVERPAVPDVVARHWVRTPIDAFVLARLEESDLAPGPRATRQELIRRAYYDLTGLPPTPAEVEAFVADDSPGAFEALVDRLLDSPRYGERWGRHWLDLVRFGETHSFERDEPKPFAWRYRDWVIDSFNADTPYDVFVREQIAGDELDEATPESIIATGFYRLGPWDDEPTDPLQAVYDELDGIVTTTGEVFLGLTVNCARCHDHKLDPLPQSDYYRMLAFFHGIRPTSKGGDYDSVLTPIASAAELEAHEREKERIDEARRETGARLASFERQILESLPEAERGGARGGRERRELVERHLEATLPAAEVAAYRDLKREQAALARARPPEVAKALSVRERGREAPETHVLLRGNAHTKGERVSPGFPAVLGGPEPRIAPAPEDASSPGRRRAFAEWLTSASNPLTARVMVNRIWQYHFGRGLVRSSNNFGKAGTPPTHPELLDWLASELVSSGWRIKAMHRLIMRSNAYRMSSRGRADGLEKDPTNELFWRFDVRRLSAEEVRDSILAVNGTLNLEMGGPGVYTVIPKAVLQGQSRPGDGWGTSSDAERSRRSVYVHVKRSLITPFLESFDFPDTDSSCPVRFSTTQPTQALTMLNSEFMQRESRAFAARLLREAGAAPEAQARLALALAFQREPRDDEVARGVELMQRLRDDDGASAADALRHFALIVLNTNEFITID